MVFGVAAMTVKEMREKINDTKYDDYVIEFEHCAETRIHLIQESKMTKEEVLTGLIAGKHLRCDRRDESLLPWLLDHPNITNSGIIQVDDQSSYIEFWWKDNV
jgi:hypothetical protein